MQFEKLEYFIKTYSTGRFLLIENMLRSIQPVEYEEVFINEENWNTWMFFMLSDSLIKATKHRMV